MVKCEWRIYDGSEVEYTLTNPRGVPEGLIKDMIKWGYKPDREIKQGVGYAQLVFSKKGKYLSNIKLSDSRINKIETEYQGTGFSEHSTNEIPPKIDEKIAKKMKVFPIQNGVMLVGKKPSFPKRSKYNGHRQEIDKLYNTRVISTNISESDMVERLFGPLEEQLGYAPKHDKETENIVVGPWVPLTKKYMNRKRRNHYRGNGFSIQRQSFWGTRTWKPNTKEGKKVFRDIKKILA